MYMYVHLKKGVKNVKKKKMFFFYQISTCRKNCALIEENKTKI